MGVSPMLLVAFTSQPELSNNSQVLLEPERAAQCRAMFPSESVINGLAPRSKRCLAI